MCPLQINDFSPEVRSDVAEFFAEFEPLVLKISNDYAPEIFWSIYADCDEMRVLDYRPDRISKRPRMSLLPRRKCYSTPFVSVSFLCYEPHFEQLSLF